MSGKQESKNTHRGLGIQVEINDGVDSKALFENRVQHVAPVERGPHVVADRAVNALERSRQTLG